MAWASFGTILAQVYWKSNLILVGMHLLLWILLFCWYSEVITPRPGWCNTCHCRTYFHAEPQGRCVSPQCAKTRNGLNWCRHCDCRTYRRKPHSRSINSKCPAYQGGQLRLAETELTLNVCFQQTHRNHQVRHVRLKGRLANSSRRKKHD